MAYIIQLTGTEGARFWAYGYPGKWVSAQSDARLYAKRSSAENARKAILRSRPEMRPESVSVLEVLD